MERPRENLQNRLAPRPLVPFKHADFDAGLEDLAREVVDSVREVRTSLGVGLSESVYVECFSHELHLRGLRVEREIGIPLVYKGVTLPKRLRVDLLVEGRILVEAKAVEALHPVHFAQTLTYQRLAGCPVAFLVNFNQVPLREGIHRLANSGRR